MRKLLKSEEVAVPAVVRVSAVKLTVPVMESRKPDRTTSLAPAATLPATGAPVLSIASAAVMVCAPPAAVAPDWSPAANVRSLVVTAATLIVLPASAVEETSTATNTKPVVPELIDWFSEDSACAPVPRPDEMVPSSVSVPGSSVLFAE